MRYDLAIRGGTVVSPRGQPQIDLWVKNGKVAALGNLEAEAGRVVDARGLFVIPGAVDGHVHFQDPGATHREDFMTGTGAAAVGGVTTVIEHQRTEPVVLTAKVLREKAAYLANRAIVDYGLLGGGYPENLHELQGMWEAGAAGFKSFTCNLHGVPALLPGDMLAQFRAVAGFDGTCLIHAEDEFITARSERELKAAGRKDPRVIPEWRSREAEEVAVNTVALLARLTNCRVVVAHASHPAVIDLINRERTLGARLSIESCPQYFYLTEDEIDAFGPFHKFTPPARSQAEVEGMWERLRRGEITMVCADHAPATKDEKTGGDIWSVPFGIPGVELTINMLLNAVAEGKLPFERLVSVFAEGPARAYRFYPQKGALEVGSDADIVLVDLRRERTLRDEDVVSKVRWTPYVGRKIKGQPVMTFVRGTLVAEEGKVVGAPGSGRFLPGPGLKAAVGVR